MLKKNFVRFYPSLIDVLENRLGNNYSYDDREELENFLKEIQNKSIIPSEKFNFLYTLNNFIPAKFIFCYTEYPEEKMLYTKMHPSFFDTVETKKINLDYQKVAKVGAAINKRKGISLPTLQLRRIEYLFNYDFSNYVLESRISKNNLDHTLKLNYKEEKEIIYQVMRWLSSKYKYGYKLDYNTNSFLVEKGRTIRFYWKDEKIYLGKEMVCYLFEGVKKIALEIDYKYKEKICRKI